MKHSNHPFYNKLNELKKPLKEIDKYNTDDNSTPDQRNSQIKADDDLIATYAVLYDLFDAYDDDHSREDFPEGMNDRQFKNEKNIPDGSYDISVEDPNIKGEKVYFKVKGDVIEMKFVFTSGATTSENRLNEGEARAAHLKNQQDRYGGDAKWGKMVPPPGYSDGSQRIPNFQSLDDLNRTLISFELNPIDIQDHNESFGLNHTEATFVGQVNAYFAYGRLGLEVNNLIDSIYYPDEETKTNAFADPKDQIDDRIALQNFSKKSHAQQYDHPLNEVKKSIRKSIRKYQRAEARR